MNYGKINKFIVPLCILLACSPGAPQSPSALQQKAQLVQQVTRLLDAQRAAEAVQAAQQTVVFSTRSFGSDHVETGQAWAVLANALSRAGQLEESLAAHQRALRIYEQTLGPDNTNTAVAQMNVASMMSRLSSPGDAAALARRAFETQRRLLGPQARVTVDALCSLGAVLSSRDRLREATEVLGQCLQSELAARDRNPGDVGAARVNLGNVLSRAGRYEDALLHHREALQLAQRHFGNDHFNTSISHANVGRVHSSFGRHAKAVEHFQEVLRIREAAAGVPAGAIADAHLLLAWESLRQGRYAPALAYARRTVSLLEGLAQTDSTLYASAMSVMGQTLGALGRYDAMLDYAARSAEVYRKRGGESSANYALALSWVAQSKLAQRKPREALTALNEAMMISRAIYPAQHARIAWLQFQLARVHLELGEPDAALEFAVLARQGYAASVGPQAPPSLGAALEVARIRLQQGAVQEALVSLKAIERSASASDSPELLWSTQSVLAEAHLMAGSQALAEYWWLEAISTIETQRTALTTLDESLQSGYLTAERRKPFEQLAGLYGRQGRIDEAAQVMRQLKRQEIAMFSGGALTDSASRFEFNAETQRSRHALELARSNLAKIEPRVRELDARVIAGGDTPEDQERLLALRQEQTEARRAHERALADLERVLTRGESSRNARVVVEQVRAHQNVLADLGAAGQRVAIVQYVVAKDGMHIFVSTAHSQRAFRVDVKSTELDDRVAEFRAVVQRPHADPRPAAQTLHNLLLGPAQSFLQAERVETLMLSLDGALRYVPFSALHDGRQFLVRRYRIALYTEASKSRIAALPSANWTIAAMGVSRGFPEQSLAALPAVEAEIAGIVHPSVLPGTAVLNQAFNRAALERSMNQSVVHIASHFKLLPGSDESFLLLGDGTRLTLGQLRTELPRFGNVDLLTLSACDTAVGGGRGSGGLEVEALGVVAQERGARAVVASLWPVADSSTGDLMQAFYRTRQSQGVSKAEALRLAQIELIEGGQRRVDSAGGLLRGARTVASGGPQAAGWQVSPGAPFSHPFFWSAFVLIGNWL